MQNYVKNMNNELFLSEYQINNLYALLLIGRSAPWDSLKYIPLNQGQSQIPSSKTSTTWLTAELTKSAFFSRNFLKFTKKKLKKMHSVK